MTLIERTTVVFGFGIQITCQYTNVHKSNEVVVWMLKNKNPHT